MKRFFRVIFISITILVAVLYGLACLTPVISPERFVLMGFLGLAFPILLLAIALVAIMWLFIRKKTALLLFLFIACGSYHIAHLFGWHSANFSAAKAPGTVRIIGWNVQGFSIFEIQKDTFNSRRHQLFRYLQQQQADILCLQDFLEYDNKLFYSNIHMLADSLGYPFYFTSNDYVEYPPWGPAYSGIAIFSRYPLQNTQRIAFTGKKIPESIITADVTISGKTRRLIVTHLQSMNLRNSKPNPDPWNVVVEDTGLNHSGTAYQKLSYYLPYHATQARQVKKVIDESPWPVILSADMNEVPSSWCYYTIKGGLQDAFLKKGSGLGRTYTAISPTLRIDYLMTSDSMEIVQYRKDTVQLSDHYPQMMDVKW